MPCGQRLPSQNTYYILVAVRIRQERWNFAERLLGHCTRMVCCPTGPQRSPSLVIVAELCIILLLCYMCFSL